MKKKEIIMEAAGIWKEKFRGSSVEYVRKIREEWEKRIKRFEKSKR